MLILLIMEDSDNQGRRLSTNDDMATKRRVPIVDASWLEQHDVTSLDRGNQRGLSRISSLHRPKRRFNPDLAARHVFLHCSMQPPGKDEGTLAEVRIKVR